MKYYLLLCILCCFHFTQAQPCNTLYFPHQTLPQINETNLSNFLKNYFSDLQSDDIQLHQTFERSTQVSKHVTFEILYQQIPLFRSCIQVNLSIAGEIISIKKEHVDLSILKNYQPADELKAWSNTDLKNMTVAYWGEKKQIKSLNYTIECREGLPMVAAVCNTWDHSFDNTLLLDITGNKLFESDQLRHANIDTTIHIKIFNPDPLTTLGLSYGGTQVDNNDANSTWLNGAYVQTTIAATFDNATNTFYPENQYAKIEDLEGPNLIPVTSTNDTFYFDRSQSGFEDVNTLYHITHFHDYISSIGYDTLMDLQLQVDTHAQFGADNSVFNKNGGNPTVLYGIGGVDDAEDADVIIHEYCHGISWSANNNSLFSYERSALDEGLADYFAVSYSRAINPFNWQDVFNWDGPIWGGRTATTLNHYPLTSNFYKLGEIWNAAMSSIWTDLGQIVTDKLMLESLHFFTNNTTLPEAAMYVLQADTLLFGGIHSGTICNKFQLKNILDANCKPSSLKETSPISNLQIHNSIGFAANNENVRIEFPMLMDGHFELNDISGKLVAQGNIDHQQHLEISPIHLKSGMYLLNMITTQGHSCIKLIRY